MKIIQHSLVEVADTNNLSSFIETFDLREGFDKTVTTNFYSIKF